MKNDRIRVGLIGANPGRGWTMGVHVPALQGEQGRRKGPRAWNTTGGSAGARVLPSRATAGTDGIRLQRRPTLCPGGGGHPRRHIARAGFRASAQTAHIARYPPARVGYGAAADAVIVRKRGASPPVSSEAQPSCGASGVRLAGGLGTSGRSGSARPRAMRLQGGSEHA